MALSDNRLRIINQMVLAVLFAVGLLAFLFVLLLLPQKDLNQVYVTIVSNLLSIIGTVVVMQQTHFFKSPDSQSEPPTPVQPMQPIRLLPSTPKDEVIQNDIPNSPAPGGIVRTRIGSAGSPPSP
jgi:flagellar basal body-associated protein FliL